MLLQLPTELIQLVLRNCDTPAYFQAAFASRRLYEIASNSREVIIHQLNHTPGWNEGIEVHQTRDLFHELRRRSHEQLDGIEFYIKPTFSYQNRAIDCHASTLEASKDGLRALVVSKGHSTVHLLDMCNGKRTQVELEAPGQNLGSVEIIQTAFDGGRGVYVLHRFKPFRDRELDTDHPFVRHALESRPNGSVHLAYHHLNPQKTTVYDFPESQDYTPLALSATDGKFAISWQNIVDPTDHDVILYTWLDNEDDEKQDTTDAFEAYVLASSTEQDPDMHPSERTGPVVRLAFNDRGFQLLHHYRGQNIYGGFQRIYRLFGRDQGELRPHVSLNACTVQFSHFLSLQFSIGIPFFGTHEFGDGNQGGQCHWQYLAFGIATHRVENWTVACLLKSETYTGHRCTHVLNLDRGRRFDNWQIMAHLGGFQELTTSHGSRVATSRRGTRIAVANWKTLYIWALNPSELIDGNGSGFYPRSWEISRDVIELRPVIIQLEAVCSLIQFTEKEDEVVAITDRGLMQIDLSLGKA